MRGYDYVVSPNEKRVVGANARFANDMWTVVILDFDKAVAEKRGAQIGLIFGKLLPKGYTRESFAGKQAHTLDKARIAELTKFVETSQKRSACRASSFGIVENGKVVFVGGFGVRELGKPAKVDGDTKFIIASNTKALTTLMLAKLVDEKKLTWDTLATTLLPSFKLGDADTTSKVMVKHLICACTGLPRQDIEWLLRVRQAHAAKARSRRSARCSRRASSASCSSTRTRSPPRPASSAVTSRSRSSSSARRTTRRCRRSVFDPLGMTATTFDFKKGQRGNYAAAARARRRRQDGARAREGELLGHPGASGRRRVEHRARHAQVRPDGARRGQADRTASRTSAKDALLARRAPQVAIGKDATYGMGLMVDTKYGVTVVHHGGDMIGFHSDMMWLPEQQRRRGDPDERRSGLADPRRSSAASCSRCCSTASPRRMPSVAAAAKSVRRALAAMRKLLTVPADAGDGGQARRALYEHGARRDRGAEEGRGDDIRLRRVRERGRVAQEPDGSVSFLTIAPGVVGFEFVVGETDGKPTLTIRDAQHEYVFTPG